MLKDLVIHSGAVWSRGDICMLHSLASDIFRHFEDHVRVSVVASQV